jgi:hypothetical protein
MPKGENVGHGVMVLALMSNKGLLKNGTGNEICPNKIYCSSLKISWKNSALNFVSSLKNQSSIQEHKKL